ncbi:MAG TPA: hypothetical protein VM840_05560 [Actinomycetota bacterium]|nr:hypothetical protein [Actinomycetota bacterium]
MSLRRTFPAALGLLALVCAGCADDRVRLERGPLGPASYRVTFEVTGDPAVRTEPVTAQLTVTDLGDGAALRLDVGDEIPIVTEFVRGPDGRLVLDTVQGVSPSSAGEADLASIVDQLDPPLASGPVRMREPWSARRRITTEVLRADLTTRLEVVRFHRVAGTDAAELRGTVTGRLRTTGTTGTFDGRVVGTTTIDWALAPGRVAASRTELRWAIPDIGTVLLRTSVSPS